jgi:glutaredoxin 3
MRFFGFGKKRLPDPAPPSAPASGGEQPAGASAYREIVVYGTSDGTRCRQLRALLEQRGYAYQDVRVDDDLSTRSWLQGSTGDDALPKIFIGPQCYGGFEDVQVLVFDGSFDRLLRGEAPQDDTQVQAAALKAEMSPSAIVSLLRRGEILTITEAGMAMDAWSEPFANPPLVYYEGVQYPIDALESIAEQIVARLQAGEIEVSWKEDT